jgi:hypothetical protein
MSRRSDRFMELQLFVLVGAGIRARDFGRPLVTQDAASSRLVGIAANESIRTSLPVAIHDLVALRPSAKHLSEL